MVTAVDSSVIFDFVIRDSVFARHSREALESSVAEGRVVACGVVWAEIAGLFTSAQVVRQMFDELRIEFSPLTAEAAIEAGRVWKAYRERGGSRSRVTADFLIGAHALLQADRLLTRDRGFYRTYFKHLRILDPRQRQ